MGNKAVSKAVIQVALVIGLVLAANAIKPLSPGNLALHTLASARSFSFVLPSGAVEKIEHVSLLAQAYSRSLSDSDKSDSIWTKESVMKSGLLASNNPAELFDDAEIKDVKSCEPAKKQTPAKRATRRVRQDNRGNHDEVSASELNASRIERQIAMLPVAPAIDSVAMAQPVSLPVFKMMPTKAHLTQPAVMFPLMTVPAKLHSCKTIEVKEVKLIALIQQSNQSPKLKVDLLATQPAKITLHCREEEKVVTEEAESVLESTTTTGPQEELFFDQPFGMSFMATPVPECPKYP
jgi:hypothetical protein